MGFHVAQTQKIPPSDGGRRKVKTIFSVFDVYMLEGRTLISTRPIPHHYHTLKPGKWPFSEKNICFYDGLYSNINFDCRSRSLF